MPFHDQLFKDLLRAFFADLLTIVVPDLVPRMRLDQLAMESFQDTEVFTDMPRGKRRRVDLLVQIPTRDGETQHVLVHVEIQARAVQTMDWRMRDYGSHIIARHELPLLPILINLHGGKPGVRKRTVPIKVLGEQMGSFCYYAFSLSPSEAQDYLQRPEPLAWALASLMRTELRPAEHKLACLRPIVHEPSLDEARRFLLANCVETYVELDDDERAAYDALVADDRDEGVRIMQMTWADKIEARGREAGLVEGARQLLLHLLCQRFGHIPVAVKNRLGAIESTAELESLADHVLTANSLEDLGLLRR